MASLREMTAWQSGGQRPGITGAALQPHDEGGEMSGWRAADAE